MTQSTKYLDLDAVDLDADVTINWKGVKHKLSPITVEQFIQNTKKLQEIGGKPNLEQEFEIVLVMVHNAFPTIPMADLKTIELVKLNKILEFAREYNGEQIVKADQEADAAANPPKAGS